MPNAEQYTKYVKSRGFYVKVWNVVLRDLYIYRFLVVIYCK